MERLAIESPATIAGIEKDHDPMMALLSAKGNTHESNFLKSLQDTHGPEAIAVVNSKSHHDRATETLQYMEAGYPFIYQAYMSRDGFAGSAGTRDYCPMIFRTDKVRTAEQYDFKKNLANLETEYGQDLLMRSAVWLTIKESQASFKIEHEDKQIDRIKRFASRHGKTVRIPVKVATQSTGTLPPKPVKAATPSERSDAGGLFLLYLVSCRQICLLFSE
jgi:hypothetical protein